MSAAAVSVRLAQALDVLDKQYRLYSWNDAKSLSLITTNSVLFAAIGFLFAACLPDALAMLFMGCALFFISLSLVTVLLQVIPQGSSGKSGVAANVRSLRGICSFDDWQAYHDHFCTYSDEQFAEDAIRQAYGMANNNDKSRGTVQSGVTLTLFGIIFLFAAAVTAALSARGVHVLGSWATPPALSAQTAQAQNANDRSSPQPLATAPSATPGNGPARPELIEPTSAQPTRASDVP